MSGPLGFRLSVDGWHAVILTDCAEALTVLDRYLLPWLPRHDAHHASADVVLEIHRTADGMHIRPNGRNLVFAPTAHALIPTIEACLDEAFVRAVGLVPIHAAVAAADGLAVLLPGSSHAGKTTLVRELLRRGFTYFSDEYGLLDEAGLVHPYPRALMLRDGRGETAPALASDYGAPVAAAPAPVALVAALVFKPAAGWDVHPVPQSAMLLELLKHTPRLLGEQAEILQPLTSVVASARCCAGTRGDVGEAADRLIALLEQSR